MSKKPENLNTIRQSCGSRVVVNGVSCISPITDREMYDSSLLYSAAKNKHAKESLVWKPMSEDWKENCREEFWFQDTVEEAIRLHPQMDRRLFDLKERLLSFAGEAVCLPAYEPDLENILSYGQFWLGYNAERMLGEDCHCHSIILLILAALTKSVKTLHQASALHISFALVIINRPSSHFKIGRASCRERVSSPV